MCPSAATGESTDETVGSNDQNLWMSLGEAT